MQLLNNQMTDLGSRFWLFDWIDDNALQTVEDARKHLSAKKSVHRLKGWATQSHIESNPPGTTIVAGAGIDFGDMCCPSERCARIQVDRLFTQVWHYFDRIIVDDRVTPLIRQKNLSNNVLVNRFLEFLPVFFYLKEIGADKLVECVVKEASEQHIVEHAVEQGLQAVLDSTAQFLPEVTDDNTIFRSGMFEYYLPEVGISLRNKLPTGLNSLEKKAFVAHSAFTYILSVLTEDLRVSRTNNACLGSVLEISSKMLSKVTKVNAQDVMFHLQLPFLDGISTKELLKLRNDERDAFEQFRTRLRRAAEERINAQKQQSPAKIAEEIKSDLIDPSLEEIRRRLQTSQRALTKKTAAGMFIGALATTCGLILGVPPNVAVPAGVASSLSMTASAACKHIDDKRDVELHDLYFLWNATHGGHN